LLFALCMLVTVYFVVVLMPHIVTGLIAAIMGLTVFLALYSSRTVGINACFGVVRETHLHARPDQTAFTSYTAKVPMPVEKLSGIGSRPISSRLNGKGACKGCRI
jgi:hypothetical protein